MSNDFDKYLAIANKDIQRAIDDGQLKYYVASILYNYDKKVELLQKRENIIKEVREYIENKQELNKMFGTITLSKESQKELLEILDKVDGRIMKVGDCADPGPGA